MDVIMIYFLNLLYLCFFSVERKTLLQDLMPLLEPFTGPLTQVG